MRNAIYIPSQIVLSSLCELSNCDYLLTYVQQCVTIPQFIVTLFILFFYGTCITYLIDYFFTPLQRAAEAYLQQYNATHLFAQGSWEHDLVGTCRTHLNVKPKITEGILFYSQVVYFLALFFIYLSGTCCVFETSRSNWFIWHVYLCLCCEFPISLHRTPLVEWINVLYEVAVLYYRYVICVILTCLWHIEDLHTFNMLMELCLWILLTQF